jgi:hypothetical protein
MDLCLEYQELLVSAGETTERAVVTSYQCRNAHIDSTGQSPSKSPTLAVDQGSPIDLHFAVDRRPTEVEVRLYPSAGVSASFARWPEELPTEHEPIDQLLPEPSSDVRYPVHAPPGEYSLVVRAAWGEEVDVFYAISFLVHDEHVETPVANAPLSLEGLVRGLRALGMTVVPTEPPVDHGFAIEGVRLLVDEAAVFGYEFADAEAAQAAAGGISMDEYSLTVTTTDGEITREHHSDWIETPHVYLKGRVIVLVGDHPQVLDALASVLGSPRGVAR